ncbi:MAG: hypothetical protein OEV68_13120, partial [candidate division Zixibacteria bacterium]|nr:hypothetical protein [candidate division Zixibacteria bacterium]
TIPQRDTGMTSARMLSEMGAIEILNWLIEPSDSLEIMLMVAPTIEGLVEVSAAGPGSPTDDWEVVVLGSEDRFGNGFGLVPSIWLALSMSTFILLIAIALLYRRVAVRFSLDTVDSSSSPRDGEGKV